MKDDDGIDVMHGDVISFSFGLPPREGRCKVYLYNSVFFAFDMDRPNIWMKLRNLRRHVGRWYIELNDSEYERRTKRKHGTHR